MDAYRASMTEAEMLKAIRDYAGAEGGYCFHVRDARGQAVEGLPDTIVLIPRTYAHPGIVGFFEIKTQRDRTTALQRSILAVAGQATEVVSGIIRPKPKDILLEITLDDALELLGKEPW